MSDTDAFPLPDLDFAPLAPLWEGAARGVFQLPRCAACGMIDWYPKGRCRACACQDIHWATLSGKARLHSWAVVHRALHKPLGVLGPYVSAIVRIAEDERARFVTRIVDAAPESLRVDMPVHAVFRDAAYPALKTGTTVPLFTPVDEPRRGKP